MYVFGVFDLADAYVGFLHTSSTSGGGRYAHDCPGKAGAQVDEYALYAVAAFGAVAGYYAVAGVTFFD